MCPGFTQMHFSCVRGQNLLPCSHQMLTITLLQQWSCLLFPPSSSEKCILPKSNRFDIKYHEIFDFRNTTYSAIAYLKPYFLGNMIGVWGDNHGVSSKSILTNLSSNERTCMKNFWRPMNIFTITGERYLFWSLRFIKPINRGHEHDIVLRLPWMIFI